MSGTLDRRLKELERQTGDTRGVELLVDVIDEDGNSTDPDFPEKLAKAQQSKRHFVVFRTNVRGSGGESGNEPEKEA